MRSVYVASAGPDRHKIGVSSDPARRLRSLSGASGYQLILRAALETPAAEDVERMAHWLLRAARLHGEWFSVDAATAQAAVAEAVARIEAGEFLSAGELRHADWVSRPMGRPKLHVRATTVQLTEEMLARIATFAPGVKDRSKFIREAVEAELERRERQKP